jgi:hypothetical protein
MPTVPLQAEKLIAAFSFGQRDAREISLSSTILPLCF